jgi:hypothetical protein
MHIVRAFCFGAVLVALSAFGLAVVPGCGDDSPPSGTTVKVDPNESVNRQKKIEELYKSKQQKGPGGQAPQSAPAN